MISFLRGTLYYKKPPLLIIELSGIGYECQAPMSTFYQLPEVGVEVFLYTHLVVREDAHTLYAFSEEHERSLFRSLIKVTNVGPKLALAILSGISADHFVKCILEHNIDVLTHIPGVGKKTAERLFIELRDRLQDWGFQPVAVDTPTAKQRENRIVKDALSALVALGYKPQEASRLISSVAIEYGTAEDLIRLALQSTLKGDKNDYTGSPD